MRLLVTNNRLAQTCATLCALCPHAEHIVATSITSGGDGTDQCPETPQIPAQNPHMKFFNDQRGYLSIDVTPEQWQTHFRIIDYVSRRGAALKTRASYVVEAGRPSLQGA